MNLKLRISFNWQHTTYSLHVIYFLTVGSWVMWFFSFWGRKNCMQRWANSQNDNRFHSNLRSHLGLFSFMQNPLSVSMLYEWPKTRSLLGSPSNAHCTHEWCCEVCAHFLWRVLELFTAKKLRLPEWAKGQAISEWLFGVFNFPKKQQCKNLMNFCPRI